MKTFDTSMRTIGFITGTFAFLALMNRFHAHLKLTASKWYAKHKVEQMERAAAEEDAAADKKAGIVNRKREFNSEVSAQTYSRWD